MGFFDELQQLKELSSRTSEAMGGVYSDPFNEIAAVISVSDPKKLGRVKVEYQDGTTSDWVYVLGSGKGLLSAQLIGSSCLIGKAHGNSGDAFVLGFFNKNPNVSSGGAPLQLTLLDEQVDSYRAPQSPGKRGDQGLRCNKGNAGRIYLLQNETNHDVVVCMRRNNPQEGGGEVWNWKSLTGGKWIEKGFDPGVSSPTITDYSEKKGIPECSQAMDGDVRDFAEDRKFRTFQIKCGKDENGTYNWKPVGAPPVQIRRTLPPCTERTHGITAVLDEGLNSQHVVCLRYQGQMKWVNAGKREPIQFHRQDPPMTKEEFLNSKKPVPAFKESSGMGANDYVGNSAAQVLQAAAKAIPAAIPTTPLGAALKAANALSGAFDGAKLLSDIAKTVIVNNGTVPVDSLVSQISSALNSGGVIDDSTSAVLSTLGGVGAELLRGTQNGTVDSALENIGRRALNQSIRALSPEASSVYFGYMAGGIAGAMDATAALKLPFIPEEVASIIKPALSIGASVVRLQPKAVSSMVNSSVGASGSQSLNDAIATVSGVALATPQLATEIVGAMNSGDLGKVAQSLGSFSNLATMAKLGGDLSNVPQMASTALEVVGLGSEFIKAFEGGISLDEISGLLGSNPITGLLSGLAKGLGIGGSGGDCPCDPKCRKTEHFEDSDGNALLEKCGNVVANSHSSYAPEGDPTDNNNNTVAKVLDLIPTKLGEELCVPNNFDLTQLIQNVKRLNEMADRLDSARNADWPELWTEMMYTFETIEKAFKQADNNITKVESVERKLIDAQYRLINKLMVGNGSFFSKTLLSIIETSKAIRDTYNYVKRLDNAKNGGRVGVVATDSLLNVFKNITRIAALNSLSKKEANYITSNFISKADKEWKSLEPGGGLVDITSFVLGLIPIDVPPVFDKCLTKRDKSKALNDSLSAKINSPTPPQPESLFDSKLPSYLTSPQARADNPSLGSLLDQITYQQNRAQTGEAEC
jgi:hypothetical protein